MTQTSPRARAPMWMRILLAVSLALNLLIVGVVVGAVVRFGGGPPPRAGVDFALPYVRALEPGDRRAIFREVRRGGAAFDRDAKRARYAAVVAALRAEPLDRDALAALVSAQADAAKQMQGAAQEAWLNLVSDMDAAERAEYAERVAAFAERRGKKGKPAK